MTTLVPLTRGYVALIDDEDADRVLEHKWRAHAGRAGVMYAAKSPTVLMHRWLMDAPPGVQVDHANGDGLDNRRENLRFATRQQQTANSRTRAKSGYRGVNRHYHRWQALIRANGETRHLGMFDTAEDAACAYDAAARQEFGEFATLNFPEARQ